MPGTHAEARSHRRREPFKSNAGPADAVAKGGSNCGTGGVGVGRALADIGGGAAGWAGLWAGLHGMGDQLRCVCMAPRADIGVDTMPGAACAEQPPNAGTAGTARVPAALPLTATRTLLPLSRGSERWRLATSVRGAKVPPVLPCCAACGCSRAGADGTVVRWTEAEAICGGPALPERAALPEVAKAA